MEEYTPPNNFNDIAVPRFEKGVLNSPVHEKLLVKVSNQTRDVALCLLTAIESSTKEKHEAAQQAMLAAFFVLRRLASGLTAARIEGIEKVIGLPRNMPKVGGNNNIISQEFVENVAQQSKLLQSLGINRGRFQRGGRGYPRGRGDFQPNKRKRNNSGGYTQVQFQYPPAFQGNNNYHNNNNNNSNYSEQELPLAALQDNSAAQQGFARGRGRGRATRGRWARGGGY